MSYQVTAQMKCVPRLPAISLHFNQVFAKWTVNLNVFLEAAFKKDMQRATFQIKQYTIMLS